MYVKILHKNYSIISKIKIRYFSINYCKIENTDKE